MPVDRAAHNFYRTGLIIVKHAPLLRPSRTTVFLMAQVAYLFLFLPKINTMLFLPFFSPLRKVSWVLVF